MSSEKHPEKTQLKLQWEDLLFLSQQKLCLRTVPSAERARKERAEGGFGDAISLATFGYPGANCAQGIYNFLSERNWINKEKSIEDDYSLVISWLSSQYSDFIMEKFPEGKSELIQRVNDGIKDHAEKAFFFETDPAFLLISSESATLLVYDLSVYALGKIGKGPFSCDQVKAIIVDSNTAEWNAETAFGAVLKEIKYLALKSHCKETHPAIFQEPTVDTNSPINSNDNDYPEFPYSARCSLF